jgi:hypothetical protein
MLNVQCLATTPWIALVACDTNGTTYSLHDDIFTLARDSGAVSAVSQCHPIHSIHIDIPHKLLFSLYSNACIINPEYANPENFNQVMDIFSTQSLTSAT